MTLILTRNNISIRSYMMLPLNLRSCSRIITAIWSNIFSKVLNLETSNLM